MMREERPKKASGEGGSRAWSVKKGSELRKVGGNKG